MYSKLTLNIKKSVVEEAKRNARLRKKSLSRLVESYLEKLAASDSSIVDYIINNAPRKKTVPGKEKNILKKKLKQKHAA